MGPLKGRLNLEYEASVDANSIHRALHIPEPGPDLSGNYTCSVSTFQSEDIRTKNMLVFGKLITFIICNNARQLNKLLIRVLMTSRILQRRLQASRIHEMIQFIFGIIEP